MSLGSKIKYLRSCNSISMQGLADLIDCSKAHIFQIEKGKISPRFDDILAIAKVLNVPITFFTEDKPMKQNEIMQFFSYEHLPELLKKTSKQFELLAVWMDSELPNCAEKSAGLRKLLEAKDCAVRAKLARIE